jgi:hypothetical protein
MGNQLGDPDIIAEMEADIRRSLEDREKNYPIRKDDENRVRYNLLERLQ